MFASFFENLPHSIAKRISLAYIQKLILFYKMRKKVEIFVEEVIALQFEIYKLRSSLSMKRQFDIHSNSATFQYFKFRMHSCILRSSKESIKPQEL